MQSDGCTIRDVGSGNGTFLNGQRLEKNGNEEKLRPGDMIRLNTIDHLDYEYSEIVLDKGEVRT